MKARSLGSATPGGGAAPAALSTCYSPAVGEECCACGTRWADAELREATTQAVLVHTGALVQPVTVKKRVCPNCRRELIFDGLESAILNKDNTVLFTHEFLRQCVAAGFSVVERMLALLLASLALQVHYVDESVYHALCDILDGRA